MKVQDLSLDDLLSDVEEAIPFVVMHDLNRGDPLTEITLMDVIE